MKRVFAALLAGAAVFSIAFASAAVLDVNGEVIQAGVDSDLRCDADGVNGNWGLETDTNQVTFVRIDGIDAACEGAQMWIRINETDNYGPVTLTDSGQATFSFNGFYPPEDLESLRIWIEG
jgi:hypothetical protein